jgi:hypothetical protein
LKISPRYGCHDLEQEKASQKMIELNKFKKFSLVLKIKDEALRKYLQSFILYRISLKYQLELSLF